MKKQKWHYIVAIQFCGLLWFGGVQAQTGNFFSPNALHPRIGNFFEIPDDSLVWTAVEGATKYRVQVVGDGVSGWSIDSFIDTLVTTNSLKKLRRFGAILEHRKTYVWRVQAIDELNNRETSFTDGFIFSTYPGLALTEEQPINPILLKLYPNPIVENATIQFKTGQQGTYTLSCFNVLGQELWQHVGTSAGEGQNLIIPTAHFASGLYYVRLSSREYQETISFVKF